MKRLLLIPILLLAGCVGLNTPLYDRQPEIVKVDARLKTMKARLGFLDMIQVDLETAVVKRHIDLIHAFYTTMEVAFADGNTEKFQLNLNRVNAQVDALTRLLDSAKSVKPMGLKVPGDAI